MWLEEIPLGDTLDLGSYEFTKENIVAFAKLYDPQEFHIDEDAAKASPYGGLIASGWHVAAVWMRLMVAYRNARVENGTPDTQANYVSPGVREMKWLQPVRPGTVLTYRSTPFAKPDWPSRPEFGLMESNNEARDAQGTLYYSFVSRVLVLKRPN